MNKIYLLLVSVLLFACNDDYLERFPQSEITEKNFFSNARDLQTYSYQFYDYLGAEYWDRPSDNTTIEKGEIKDMLWGTMSADNIDVWNWGQLKDINYLLDNYKNAVGDEAEINMYAAMGYFARARFYIDKVKQYSDVPWYSHVLQTDDVDELYKTQDSRELVVDSIIADLEFAVTHLGDDEDKTILSKWAAYTQLARFCLYEGTYRKYHAGETDLHVTKSADYFLNKAIEAASAVMNSEKFDIHTSGKVEEDYGDLFNGGTDLQSNSEIIMYLDYDDNTREHGANRVLEFENGVSRSLADSYLKNDGSYLSVAETGTLELQDAFTNRDPRMKQSLFYQGYIDQESGLPHKLDIGKTGGYAQIKFMPKKTENHWEDYMTVYTDLPLYRYAEVLLIYAEAKAELEQLTQEDMDKTINLIRNRVELAPLTMAPPVDPVQDALYPGITTSQKAELLEIRRERRIELFAEGHRYTDMMRWKLGKIFEKAQQGLYVSASGLIDLTGNGEPDYFISDDGSNQPADLPSHTTILISDTDNSPLYLENGKSGHIMFKVERNGLGTFVEPTYYYRPVATGQILLNPNLEQLFGWD